MNINGNLVSLEEPQVMGIINVTPDSFYSDSRVSQETAILKKAEQMLTEGALILDIGGYSTRPGAAEVLPQEEIKRVTTALNLIATKFPEALLSVDTFRSVVARQAVCAGAHIVNDVSWGSLDEDMWQEVANLKVPYILMHMRGTPQTMNSKNVYDNLLIDIGKELRIAVEQLQQLGVADIVVDPGFGFAKSMEQNYELLRNLGYLKRLGLPLLVGISRKSMIYKKLSISPEEALNGTTALHMAALQQGASILRVHDVKEAKQTIDLYKALNP